MAFTRKSALLLTGCILLCCAFGSEGSRATAAADPSPPAPATPAAAPASPAEAGKPAVRRIAVIDDIPYRAGPSPSWRLDLAMPENFGGDLRPAIVIVHGGGWSAGSRRDRVYRDLLLRYAEKGYVAVSIDYRLTREAPPPACVEDVKCAVRWLRAHAGEYRVDPDRIGAYGHSAGAHLVLMLAMVPPSAGLEGDGGWAEFSSHLTCAAGGAAPVALPARMGGTEKLSALSYVSDKIPPLLLIQGTEDRIVTVASVDDFVERLKAAGVRAENLNYLRIRGANHGVAYDHFMDPSLNAMDRFFERHLKPSSR